MASKWITETVTALQSERNRLAGLPEHAMIASEIVIYRMPGSESIVLTSERDVMVYAFMIDRILSVLTENLRVMRHHRGFVEISPKI